MRYVATILFAIVSVPALVQAGTDPDDARKAELLYLLKHDCGSCHGMTRKGGLGPALLPENMQDRPSQVLVNTVLDGRAGTAMPPWRALLSEADARWLVDVLLEGKGL